MKTSQSEQKSKSKKTPLLIGGVLLAAIVIVAGVYVLLTNTNRNYAKETVAPLEASLVKAGSVEKCTTGDSGRGPDNKAPNYTIVFETSLDRTKASELVNQAAVDNGYKLSQANSAYDDIVSYYDHTTKQSPYSALKSGPVLLGVSLYDGGSHLSCANSTVTYDKSHTAVKLDLSLPEFK